MPKSSLVIVGCGVTSDIFVERVMKAFEGHDNEITFVELITPHTMIFDLNELLNDHTRNTHRPGS